MYRNPAHRHPRPDRGLPVGQASDGALSADGKRLYFTRNGLRGDNAHLRPIKLP